MKRILIAMLLCGLSAGAQVGPDQPYMLIFQSPVCRSPFTYGSTPVSTYETTITTATAAQWTLQQECPKQIQAEYFPSIEKAIERLNSRNLIGWSQTGTWPSTTDPNLKNEDVIGLFKVKRIPIAIQPSGKKTKVIEQVPQEFERDILEWKVQP